MWKEMLLRRRKQKAKSQQNNDQTLTSNNQTVASYTRNLMKTYGYRLSRKRYRMYIENAVKNDLPNKIYLDKFSNYIKVITKEKQSFQFSQIISHLQNKKKIYNEEETQSLIKAVDKLFELIQKKNNVKKKDMYISQKEYQAFVNADPKNYKLAQDVKDKVLKKLSKFPRMYMEVQKIRNEFNEKKNKILTQEYKKFDYQIINFFEQNPNLNKKFLKIIKLNPQLDEQNSDLFKEFQQYIEQDPKLIEEYLKIEEPYNTLDQKLKKMEQEYLKLFSDQKDVSLKFELIEEIQGQLQQILGCNNCSKNKRLKQVKILLQMMSQNLEVNNHPIHKNLNTNIEKKEEAYNLGEQLQIKGSIGDEQTPLEEQQYIDNENMSHKEQQKLQQTKQDNIQENDIYHNNQYNNMGLNDIQVHSIDIAPQLRNFSEDDDQQYGQQDECLYDIIEKYMEN